MAQTLSTQVFWQPQVFPSVCVLSGNEKVYTLQISSELELEILGIFGNATLPIATLFPAVPAIWIYESLWSVVITQLLSRVNCDSGDLIMY